MGSFDADEMAPLALMIRPPGSSPHHSRALVGALSGVRASKPLPLVHITSSAPSISSLALRREFLLPSPSRSSGRNWPVVVLAAPRHFSTKTMRATLLASATAVSLNLYLTVLRSSIPLAHRRRASLWPLRWLSVEQAPTTSSLRK